MSLKANFLIEFKTEEELYQFETWLKNYLDFKVTILPDTKQLYQDDANFKELAKRYKKAKKVYNDYINNNNF